MLIFPNWPYFSWKSKHTRRMPTKNHCVYSILVIWVCLKIVYPIVPNGFADHYPYEKLLFHWGYTPFSDIPIFIKATCFSPTNPGRTDPTEGIHWPGLACTGRGPPAAPALPGGRRPGWATSEGTNLGWLLQLLQLNGFV